MTAHQPAPSEGDAARLRRLAGAVSLVTGLVLLGGKLVAAWMTGSAAVLSDALESVVNVLAAGFALFSVRLASTPADANHPYGHGKVEDLSATFEGGLIVLAGGLILYESVRRFVEGHPLENLGIGAWIVGAAAAANAVVGAWLIRVGRRAKSLALVADGKHLLSDVWTSAVALVALALVQITGRSWIDPLAAAVAALNLLRMGGGLVREALRGIMDEADPEDLQHIEEALQGLRDETLRSWDGVRSRRQGRLRHVDLTAHVPGHCTVREANAVAERVREAIEEALGEAEVVVRLAPDADGTAREARGEVDASEGADTG